MDNRFDFNWEHINLFVAVADQGSLSAAARETGVSQPTIGRVIQALEADLGVSLFERHARGLRLTQQGQDLIFHARTMAVAAANLSLAAAGRADDLAGNVRITASQLVATYILPPLLARLRRNEPRIQVEVVATDAVENLLFREADIALRMVRPTQVDLIARHVADMPLGLYASHAYLAERPAPETMDDLQLHSVIGYDRSTLIIEGARQLGWEVDREFFAYRCDDQVVAWNMVLAGLGVGFTSQWVARADDRVVRLLGDLSLPVLPVWLTSHAALKTSRRVRYVFDFLGEALSAMGR